MESVTQIHIGVSRRAPHGRVSHGEPGAAVVRAVVGVAIGLDLGDAETHTAVPDLLAEEIAGNLEGVALIELAGE
jgi:hypothetical protein